ncbi:hypothetical protein ACVMIH_005175 [Bradyrhizobium sp. USDA 4503]
MVVMYSSIAWADNLVPGDSNAHGDIFVKDLVTNALKRVSETQAGVGGNDTSANGYISADGRFVVFQSKASNFVPGDDNQSSDVFVKDLATGKLAKVSSDILGTTLVQGSNVSGISADGRFITFQTASPGVTFDDVGQLEDVFALPNPLFFNPPIITAKNLVVDRGTDISAAQLFTITDPDGDPIQQIEIYDRNTNASSGSFKLSGATLTAGEYHFVSGASISGLTFTSASAADRSITDGLAVRAYDGISWGQWTSFAVTTNFNVPPTLSVRPQSVHLGESIQFATVVTASDTNGDPVSKFQVRDDTTDTGSGFISLDGVRVAASAELTADEFGRLHFTGATNTVVPVDDFISVRAFDGIAWSTWVPVVLTTQPINDRPVISASDRVLQQGQILSFDQLVSVNDKNGDSILTYQFRDHNADPHSGGWLKLGAGKSTISLDAGQGFDGQWLTTDVSATDIGSIAFMAGNPQNDTITDDVEVRAFDGVEWSDWKQFTITTGLAKSTPVVTGIDSTVQQGQKLSVSSLFSVSDINRDPLGMIEGKVSAGLSGSWYFDGAPATSGSDGVISVAWTDIDKLEYRASGGLSAISTATLQFRASDAGGWSDWGTVNLTEMPGNVAPEVQANDFSLMRGQAVRAGSMIRAHDVNGDDITAYQLGVGSAGAGSASWQLNGSTVADQSIVTATQFEELMLVGASSLGASSTTSMQVRSYDGKDWGDWHNFSITTLAGNDSPFVLPNDLVVLTSASSPISDAIRYADNNGDLAALYEIYENDASAGTAYLTYDGANVSSSAGTPFQFSDLSKLLAVGGQDPGTESLSIRAYDGIAWSDWAEVLVETVAPPSPFNQAPVASKTGGYSLELNQWIQISLNNLPLQALDADGDPIVAYRFTDRSAEGNSMHLWAAAIGNLSQGGSIEVAADQLNTVWLQGGTALGADNLQVELFDGFEWGQSVSIDVLTRAANHSPLLQAPDFNATSHNQAIAVSSLFSVSDQDSDTITKFQFWDSTADLASGHFVVGNVAQGVNQTIDVSAGQLARTTFLAGAVFDDLWVRAYDGFVWSAWAEFHVTPPVNHIPVVTASDYAASHNQSITASSLFSVSDADSDAITKYQFWDSTSDPASGHFVVGGAAQGTNQNIDVSAAQFANTTFQSGSGSDDLWLRAYDGFAWSTWKEFHVNAPLNQAPVVTASDYAANHNQRIAAASLFSVSDADSDTITKYQFWDSTSDSTSGHFDVAGTAQGTNQNIDVSAAQLANTTFQSGSGSDDLWVRAFDGLAWSAWKEFHVNAPVNHAPVVAAPNYAASHNQRIAASSLFSVSDADSDTITKYQFWDSTSDSTSGHFDVAGTAQGTNQNIDVSAAQLASTTFQSGSGSDDLWVRAYDGLAWSAWKEFHVNAPVNHAPVVAAPDYAASHNQIIAVSSLFSVSDADSDTITKYQFWDSTSDSTSGHFDVAGTAQGTNQNIDVSAAQLASTTFQSGSGSDDLWVRAFDGLAWSAWKEFHVNAPVNHAPVVAAPNYAASHNQTIAASSLFSVSDSDGDSMSTFRFWDSTTDASSGHFVVNGVSKGTNQNIDVTAAQLASTTFQSGAVADDLWVQVYDGFAWSAWQEFHVVV